MTNSDKAPTSLPGRSHDPLVLPNGTRLTRDTIRRARLSLPPTRRAGDPPWAGRPVRVYQVLDHVGSEAGELWIFWRDGPHLGRTPFIKPFEKKLRYDLCGEIAVAAEDSDWAAIDAVDAMILPWFCRSCGCIYPERVWSLALGFNDEGWINSYRGRCPQGHERVVAA